MRIIIEGNDKTGKSTLARALSEFFNMEIVKFSQPKTDNPFEEYVKVFGYTDKKWLVKLDGFIDNVICDRSWIGEQVYGPIYRDKKMRKSQVRKLDWACRENWDIIIFCNTDKNLIRKKFKEDNETFTNPSHIGRIERYFVKTLKELSTPILYYDWRIGNIDDIIYFVNNQYERKASKPNELIQDSI